MSTLRRLFRQAAVLALVAILGLALAPTVSHALAAQQLGAQPWSELCAFDGGPDAGARLAHCPLCAQPGHTPVLPGTPASAGLPPERRSEVPALTRHEAVAAMVWVAPPSRAPPRAVPA